MFVKIFFALSSCDCSVSSCSNNLTKALYTYITCCEYTRNICMHINVCRNISSFIKLKRSSFEDLCAWQSSDKSEYTKHSVFFICFNRGNFTSLNILNFHP